MLQTNGGPGVAGWYEGEQRNAFPDNVCRWVPRAKE